jgi:hypothetical protein
MFNNFTLSDVCIKRKNIKNDQYLGRPAVMLLMGVYSRL